MIKPEDLADYRAALLDVLRNPTVERMRRHAAHFGILTPADDEALMAGAHKVRVICSDISEEMKAESAAWLRERGYAVPTVPEARKQ